MDVAFSGATSLPSYITFTRASSATSLDASGILQTASTDVPRFDHDPVTLQPLGLLIEGQRTNLAVYSADIGNASGWNLSAATAASNQTTSPDGTNTAGSLAESGGTAVHYAYNTSKTVASGTTYSYTQFYKAATATVTQLTFTTANFTSAYVNHSLTSSTMVSSGTGGISGNSVQYPNNWWRKGITQAASSSGTGNGLFFQLVNNDINAARSVSYASTGKLFYAWGGQFEVGSFPSSYIPTEGVAATRARDDVTIADLSSIGFNAQETTVYVKFRLNGSIDRTVWQIEDDDAGNRLSLVVVSNVLYARAVVSGSTVADLNLGSVSNGVDYSVAFSANANAFYASVNNGAPVSDVSGAMPSGLTTFRIGSDTSSNKLFGTIAKLAVYPVAVGANVQGITQ